MMRTRFIHRIGASFLAAICLLGVRAMAAQAPSLEAAVKATYLYKFAPFVGWPDSVFVSSAGRFEICVLGDSGFATLVARGVAGLTIDERPFTVQSLASANAASGCEIVFVGGPDLAARDAALGALRGKPVLTVTDAGEGVPHGIINFVVAEGRVRFEIDLAEASRDHLTISSKLLSLAVSVQSASSPRQP